MKSICKRTARALPVAVGALLLVLGLGASPVVAEEPESPYGPTDRPVFLIASLTDTFVVPDFDEQDEQPALTKGEIEEREPPSPLLIVPVGVYVAGQDIGDTRYEGQDLGTIDFSALPIPAQDLDMNAATIVGSFCTLNGTIHLVTPDPDPVLASVQEAVFNASATLEDLLIENPFPTTEDLVYYIADHQEGAGASLSEIADALFRTDIELDVDEVTFTAAAEGDLFPHEPDEALFQFELDVDLDTGEIRVDVCLPIDFDVKPDSDKNPWNLKSKGVLPVAILSDAFFDAPGEVDVDTLEILGVAPDKWHVEDVDGDGRDDLKLHWKTQALVAAGADADTTLLHVRGETKLGMCIEGMDAVTIVPQKGKKK